MSPTPEQLARTRQELSEETVKKENQERRLSGLNEAIEQVEDVCIKRVRGGDGAYCFCTHFLLDNRDGITSLHPIIQRLPSGEEVQGKFFLMLGKNFEEPVGQIGWGNVLLGEKVRVTFGKGPEGWEEVYSVFDHFVIIPKGRLGLVFDNDSRFIHDSRLIHLKGVITWADQMTFETQLDGEGKIALKEAVVVALANAAGIKPEDEESEQFPLLLEQLQRLKSEGKI